MFPPMFPCSQQLNFASFCMSYISSEKFCVHLPVNNKMLSLRLSFPHEVKKKAFNCLLLSVSLKHWIEEPIKCQRRCWPFPGVNHFFLKECTKVYVILVSIAWNFCDLIRLEPSSAPNMLHCRYETNYFLKNYTKHFGM